MPRGRPPKNRSKEEAVSARREQIRKNVQAFRDRKRLQQQQGSKTSQAEGEESPKSDDQNLLESKLDECLIKDKRYLVNKNDSDATFGNSDYDSIVTSRSIDQSLAIWTRLPPEISYSQLSRQQFVSNCVAAFKPESNLKTGPHWAETLPQIVNKDSTLDFSIQAICLMQLGNVKSQRWLLEEGSSYYGRALRTLNRRLPTDTNPREEVFMAMMALSVYELFQGTDENCQGWLIHYQAAFRYLKEISQAKNGWVPDNQPMFHFLETLCVFDALGSRKPSYFSTSDAWSRCLARWGGETYGPLLGLMTSVPALLEAHDALLKADATGTPSLPSKSELLNQCFGLEDRFLEWHHSTSSYVPNFTFSSSETFQGDTRLTFPNLFIARLHLLYWSALVLLVNTAASLFKSMRQSSSPSSSPGLMDGPLSTSIMLQDSLSKSQRYALSIRQSVFFCLDPDNGIVGKSIVLLPIWIAKNHFQEVGDGGEVQRCNIILAALGQRDLNFGLADHIVADGEGLTGVHWREGGLASFDGRKQLANLGAYSL